mgnify:CR=1 FL=1
MPGMRVGRRRNHRTWRVAAGAGIAALAPFLTQHAGYVLRQYAAFLQNTVTAAHVGVVSRGWSTPFTALRVAGFSVPERVQTASATPWSYMLKHMKQEPPVA